MVVLISEFRSCETTPTREGELQLVRTLNPPSEGLSNESNGKRGTGRYHNRAIIIFRKSSWVMDLLQATQDDIIHLFHA